MAKVEEEEMEVKEKEKEIIKRVSRERKTRTKLSRSRLLQKKKGENMKHGESNNYCVAVCQQSMWSMRRTESLESCLSGK